MVKIGYLGPEGTFSHEAMLNFQTHTERADIKEAHLMWEPTFAYIYSHFSMNKFDKIFIPIENSVGGGVVGNMDILTPHSLDPGSLVYAGIVLPDDVYIESEFIQPVKLVLGNQSGDAMDVRVIMSHQQPIEQSAYYLRRFFPNAQLLHTVSTKDAVEMAKNDPSVAAIASEKGFEGSGLHVIARDIQDNPNNATRFVLLGRDKTIPTGDDKSSIVISLNSDEAGSLYHILGILARSHPPINLTRIESRPTKSEMGEYWFFLDMEGHQDDGHIAHALDKIREKSKEYKFLGSYPRYR